jgi:YD repeat-containing protein
MKLASDIKRLISLAVIALVLVPAVCHAEGKNYFYDDSGTLMRSVTEEGEAWVYEYDDTGNLLRIRTTTIEAAPPELYGISPEIFFVGDTATFIISGKNLFTTSSVTSVNPGIEIAVSAADDTSITGRINTSSASELGPTEITVTTHYGTVSIPVGVAELRLTPRYSAIVNGDSIEITANIEPVFSKDAIVVLKNQTPGVIEVPESVVIPAGGSATISVSALSEGPGILRVGDAWAVVFVGPPYEGPLTATSAQVSVAIEKDITGITTSLPVSVAVERDITGITVSLPVSVEIQPSP